MSLRRLLTTVVVVAVLIEQAWLLFPLAKRLVFPAHEDPAVAGRRLAVKLGCFSCHGPEGSAGIENAGSSNKVVPALAGGEMMMWAESEQELREWILHGHRLDGEAEERSGLSAGAATGRALVMPAFASHIDAGELDQLVAYLKAISGLQFPSDEATAKGLSLAYELGCFRCHGPMGTGGVANPGSLKGYVPGFWGPDYEELVRSREELRQWIGNGVSDRLRDNPIASRVIAGQVLKMPAYAEFLSDEQIESLMTMVAWLDSGQWRSMKVP